MKRKIVINVPMHHDKAKSKAMKIAVAANGVNSVSVGGNDVLVVIGEGVDAVCLAKSLRKKFCFANVVSVEEIKPEPPPVPTPPSTPPWYNKLQYPYCIYPTPCPCRSCDEPPSNCSIS